MPAAAVIPAPIAYIKVVAVKKLVVGFWCLGLGPPFRCVPGCQRFRLETVSALNGAGTLFRPFTLRKSECSKQAHARTFQH